MSRGEGAGRIRSERKDKKHRFQLRLDQDLFYETDAITFKYRLSLNFLYTEAIEFAIHHPEFMQQLEREFGGRVNPKRGHFTYFKNI